jgi:hypothetical protein
MSLYNRDPYNPEWEPIPWNASEDVAAEQERGFHQRAKAAIAWKLVPLDDFPIEGIFGRPREWFRSNDIVFFASHAGEDLVLIQNTWSGWPDPPEWGLASRPSGMSDAEWIHWGHFPRLPARWTLPKSARDPFWQKLIDRLRTSDC